MQVEDIGVCLKRTSEYSYNGGSAYEERNYIKYVKTLCILFILSIVTFLLGFSTPENIIAENISITGEKMIIQDYKDVYGKPFHERKSKNEITSFQCSSMQINSIVIEGDEIELDYQLGIYQKKLEALYIIAKEIWIILLLYLIQMMNVKFYFLSW